MRSGFLRSSRYSPGNLDRDSLETLFVGRRDVMNDVLTRATRSIETSQKHYLLLVGPRGSGKTHFLALAHHRLMDLHRSGRCRRSRGGRPPQRGGVGRRLVPRPHGPHPARLGQRVPRTRAGDHRCLRHLRQGSGRRGGARYEAASQTHSRQDALAPLREPRRPVRRSRR